MIFTSVEFLVFAVVVFALYWWGCRGRSSLQNLLLVVASYVFYGWVDWRLCGLLLLSTGCAYGTGLWMANAQKRKRGAVIVSLILNLGILCFYKYFNFFSQSFCEVARVFGVSLDLPTLNLILPIGSLLLSCTFPIYLIHPIVFPYVDVVLRQWGLQGCNWAQCAVNFFCGCLFPILLCRIMRKCAGNVANVLFGCRC